MVSPRNDVWETSAGIPYWWCVTIQIWVALLIGWSTAQPIRSKALIWVVTRHENEISWQVPCTSFLCTSFSHVTTVKISSHLFRRQNVICSSDLRAWVADVIYSRLVTVTTNYRKCVSSFPSTWLALLTDQSWRVLKSWYIRGAKNKHFGAVLPPDLTRSSVPSVVQAIISLQAILGLDNNLYLRTI